MSKTSFLKQGCPQSWPVYPTVVCFGLTEKKSWAAVAADSWCSELKRGADGAKKFLVCQTTGPGQSTTGSTAFANIPSSNPHLSMDRLGQPCRHARLRSPACSPKIAPTTRTWRETSPPLARCSPKHLSIST